MRKTDFCLCEYKGTDQLCSTAQLICTFVFATWIVQFILYIYPKFQEFSLIFSVTAQVGLCQTRSELPKTIFLRCVSEAAFLPKVVSQLLDKMPSEQ